MKPARLLRGERVSRAGVEPVERVAAPDGGSRGGTAGDVAGRPTGAMMTVRNRRAASDPLKEWSHPRHGDGTHTQAGSVPERPGHRPGVFFLFSNRLGCLGSLLVSALLTLVLLVVLDVL